MKVDHGNYIVETASELLSWDVLTAFEQNSHSMQLHLMRELGGGKSEMIIAYCPNEIYNKFASFYLAKARFLASKIKE